MSQSVVDAFSTSRVTKLVAFAGSVLGLLAGLATGVPEGKALAARLFAQRSAAVQRELSDFSAVQFHHADPDHARQAVLAEIRILDSLEHLGPQLSPQRSPQPTSQPAHSPQEAALYIAFARLALIEEAAGQASAAQAAAAKAGEHWSRLHPGTPLTSDRMRHSVRDFDAGEDMGF